MYCMGLSLTKPQPQRLRRVDIARRPSKTAKGCRRHECAAPEDESYYENSLFLIMDECAGRWSSMNTANSRWPACRALNKDPRFAKLRRKYRGEVRSNAPYLAKPDPTYECRLGDDFRRPGCQELLKTVHSGFSRHPKGWTHAPSPRPRRR